MPGELAEATRLVHLREGIAVIREVMAEADLATSVPGCPGWSLRDLGAHIGNVQRWVRGAIAEGHPNTPEVQAPTGRADLLAWYDQGASALVDLLTATDPSTPCWSFGPKPRAARFWFRRQAHEHAIHAYDARAAAGAAGPIDTPIDTPLALDGIDEVVTMFFPRQVRLGRIPALDRSLAVRSHDGSRWVVAGDGTEGLTLADAEVSGPAEVLYLLLWRRIGLDDPRLSLDGDVAAAEAVLGTAIVP